VKKVQIIALSLVMIFIFSAVSPIQASADPNIPEKSIQLTTDPHTGTIIVKTNLLTVKLNPTFPAFTYFYTSEDGQGILYYSGYSQLIEFNDQNGDLAFQRNETVKLISLPIFRWSITTNQITYSNGTLKEIRVTYTKVGLNREMIMKHPNIPMNYSLDALNNFTMQFVAHIYTYNFVGTIQTDNESVKYTVTPNSEMKVDIIMGNFPFVNDTDLITLRVDLRTVTTKELRIMHRIRTMNRTELVNVSENWYKTGKMERLINRLRNQTLSEIDLSNETRTGFYKWLNTATITYPGESEKLVNVSATYAPDGIGIRLFLTYPNFDSGILVHDPSIGLSEISATEPNDILSPSMQTVVFGIAIITVIAMAVIVKKRS